MITILHTNDLHNCLEMMPWLAALIVRERERDPDALLLDAGDTKLGGRTADLAVQLLSSLHYDAMTPGNGETRFPAYRANLCRIGAPTVVANIAPGAWGFPTVPYLIREVEGIRLALVGLTIPVTYRPPEHPKYRPGAHIALVNDAMEAARRWVAQLRPLVDLIVVLSHLGLRNDVQLALGVPGIDLIIGGHSHHRLPSLLRIGDTHVAQAGVGATCLGVITIMIKGDGFQFLGRLEPAWQDIAVDRAVGQAILWYLRERRPEALEVVGHIPDSCWGDPYLENPWANFVTDSLREQAEADLCVYKALALVPSLNRGRLTRWDLGRGMPRPELREWAEALGMHRAVRMKLTGEAIRSICEHSVTYLPRDVCERAPPRFGLPVRLLQLSGLRAVFDLARPRGRRVTHLSVGGDTVDPQRLYTVVSSGFLAKGLNGFRWFPEGAKQEILDSEQSMVIASLRAGKTLPEVDGRLQLRNAGR